MTKPELAEAEAEDGETAGSPMAPPLWLVPPPPPPAPAATSPRIIRPSTSSSAFCAAAPDAALPSALDELRLDLATPPSMMSELPTR